MMLFSVLSVYEEAVTEASTLPNIVPRKTESKDSNFELI